jgi:hypothetical protein
MEPKALLRAVPRLIGTHLARELRGFRTSNGYSLVKVFYGNRDLHYEANHRARDSTVEIGLHFESDDLTNARLLGAFRMHERAIHHHLPSARLEEWDRGWTRIWEPVVYERLDTALRDDIAARLARYITTLEPMLREELPADVAWSI